MFYHPLRFSFGCSGVHDDDDDDDGGGDGGGLVVKECGFNKSRGCRVCSHNTKYSFLFDEEKIDVPSVLDLRV